MSGPRRPGRWRQLFGLVTTALVAAVLLLATAGPAAAHATLVGTDPVEGSLLDGAPETVTLTFSEPVRLTAQEIAVYDAEGRPVESDASASGREVTLDLPTSAQLADGTYVVGWYVVSADGHPVSGSLTFSVGQRSDTVATPPPAPESSLVVEATQAVLTALAYLGLLVAAGLVAFVAVVLPQRFAGDRVRRRIRLVVRIAAAVAAAAAALLVPVSTVYAQGLELTDAVATFDAGLAANELLFATALVVGLAAVVTLLGAGPPTQERRVGLLTMAAVAVASPALVGHTRAYEPQALLLVGDVVHLLAGATWLGGLVGLGLALRALAGREVLAAETLARFSVIAGGLVLAVAVTGSLLAWRILGSWSALLDTTYGVLLLAKLGLVSVVVAVAAWNRFRLLPRVRTAAGHDRRLAAAGLVRRSVLSEALVLVVLLGVTGVLVNQSPRPAPVEVPSGRTGVVEGSLGEIQVLAVVTPGLRGPNTVLVQLQDEAGEPVEVERKPVLELRSGDLDLGGVPVESADSGTWRAFVLLPRAGPWELQVSLRVSRFENPVTTLRFDLGDVDEDRVR